MDTSQQETLAELKRRLADIAAGTADAEAADPGTDAGSTRKRRAAAGEAEAGAGVGAARPSRRRKTAAKTADAFKEDGFGEEAPADEPWAEAAVGEEASGRKRHGKKPGRQWGRQGPDRDEPDPQSPDQEPEPLSPEEAYAEAKAIVLRQLTASPKSRRQLETKLAEREIPPDAAAAVLDRFEEVQLVDDAEFARLWVRSRSQSKSLARGALRRELTEKGIAPDLAAEALEQLSADDELEAARSLARKKLQAAADLSDRSVRDKQTRRLVGMLARKGYSPSLGFRVAAEVISEVRDTRSDSV